MVEFAFKRGAKIHEIKLISFKLHLGIGVLNCNYLKFGA
tara:strand:- start:4851 stop:4967 length:117 start_codon:yes stop_codon:yes gene_type:complete